MEIQAVKKQKNGYRINDTITVPDVYSGWMLEPLNEWLANNEPEPEFTEEEIAQQKLQAKIQEANSYLTQTDWVETYKLRHDLGLELIPQDSAKWEVISKREEHKTFLKSIGGN